MAAFFKQGVFKGQPRQTSPPKVSWGYQQRGKQEPTPWQSRGRTVQPQGAGDEVQQQVNVTNCPKQGGFQWSPGACGGAGVANIQCLASYSFIWARHSPPGKRACPEMLKPQGREPQTSEDTVKTRSIFSTAPSCSSFPAMVPHLLVQAKDSHHQQIRAVMSFLSQKTHPAIQQNTQLQDLSAAYIPHPILNEGKGYESFLWICPATCTDCSWAKEMSAES